jgi:hypothetical protein
LIRSVFLAAAIVLHGACGLLAQGPDTLWTRTYGSTQNDQAYWAQETADGGYIVVGDTQFPSFGDHDVYLLKTDANGDTLWERHYGGEKDDLGRSVFQTFPDSGYLVIGITESFGAGRNDVYLIKTDADGDTLWTKTYGVVKVHDRARAAWQTSDGGYVIAGDSHHLWAGYDYDMYILRTDADGDTLWTRVYGTGRVDERAYSVRELPDGGYIVAGYTGPEDASNYDIYLMKISAAGDSLWTQTYGGSDQDYGYSVALAADGGFVVAGYSSSYGTCLAEQCDVCLIKTDADGGTIWMRTYGGPKNDYAYSVQAVPGGGYIVAGATYSFSAVQRDIFLLKTDEDGGTVWSRTFGSAGHDVAQYVQITSDGNFLLAGKTSSFGMGWDDFYILKVSDDLVPPELTAGVLQNPYMTQYLDICLVSSEQLDPASVVFEVNSEQVPARLLDQAANVWMGDFKVAAPGGVQSIELRASDLGGNDATVAANFAASFLRAADGGRIVSPDGRARMSIEAGVLRENSCVTALPCRDQVGRSAVLSAPGLSGGLVLLAPAGETPDAYHFGPAGAFKGREAYVEFCYDASDLGPGGSPDQLVIVNDDRGPLDSYVDPGGRLVGAATAESGTFRLVLGGPGSSREIDAAFLDFRGSFPSPFRETTAIRYEIRSRQHLWIAIYDVLGREVIRLADRATYPGIREVVWDGRSASGVRVSSGLYFIKVRTEYATASGKVALTR